MIRLGATGKRRKIPGGRWRNFQKRLPMKDEVLKWFPDSSKRNVGIVTGEISNIIVLDVDSEEGQIFVDENVVPRTPTVKTNRGRHYYFQHPGFRIKTRSSNPNDWGCPGCDIKGDGGLVVAPPSIHPDGYSYRWETPLGDQPIALTPPWLLKLIRKAQGIPEPEEDRESTGVLKSGLDGDYWLNNALREAKVGCRADKGAWLAVQLRDQGFPRDKAITYMRNYAKRVPVDTDPNNQYTEEDALETLTSIYRTPPRSSSKSLANSKDLQFRDRLEDELTRITDSKMFLHVIDLLF